MTLQYVLTGCLRSSTFQFLCLQSKLSAKKKGDIIQVLSQCLYIALLIKAISKIYEIIVDLVFTDCFSSRTSSCFDLFLYQKTDRMIFSGDISES